MFLRFFVASSKFFLNVLVCSFFCLPDFSESADARNLGLMTLSIHYSALLNLAIMIKTIFFQMFSLVIFNVKRPVLVHGGGGGICASEDEIVERDDKVLIPSLEYLSVSVMVSPLSSAARSLALHTRAIPI